MTRITVPFIDANIVDVTVTGWRKTPGESVTSGEIIADVTTDKAAFEIEAPCSGTLLEVYADRGSVVPVHFILGLIGAPGEEDAGAPAENESLLQAYRAQVSTTVSDAAPASAAATPPPAAAPAAAVTPARPPSVRATPRARRLAQAHGLDLAAIQQQAGVDLITESVLQPFLPKEQP
ncbi:MAG: biotin/lipoyl-containing protein [Kiritimatiellia bacterium]|jgi:pyruvate/2-oxoglutarate dehydrogenase complex dihydrolipoamide acyltransferase (E2) component